MRTAHAGKERYVVRLMNQGRKDDAIAYMKEHGMTQAFVGAPESKPVSVPDKVDPTPANPSDYKYPDFRVARDPVPEGVRYAKIHRELGHELQKVAIMEDDQTEVLLWMGLREQEMARRRKGRVIGQVFAIEPNPEKLQGGWRLWRH